MTSLSSSRYPLPFGLVFLVTTPVTDGPNDLSAGTEKLEDPKEGASFFLFAYLFPLEELLLDRGSDGRRREPLQVVQLVLKARAINPNTPS